MTLRGSEAHSNEVFQSFNASEKLDGYIKNHEWIVYILSHLHAVAGASIEPTRYIGWHTIPTVL